MNLGLLAATFAAATCILLLLNRIAKAKHVSEALLGEYSRLLRQARERLRAAEPPPGMDEEPPVVGSSLPDEPDSPP